MASLIKTIVKVILAGIVALIILSGFTVVYCNSGIHITNTTGATDYKWEPGQFKSTMTEGFSWLRMDEKGFNNAYPAEDKVTNLLMGSSHMEAINVDSHKNTVYLLNEMLPEYTYNIGTSGHQIYNCVRNLPDAMEEYQPSGYVFLETDRIDLDVNSMKSVLDGTYPHIPSYDTGLVYMVQKYVPAIKHIYNQVDVWRKGTGNTAEVQKDYNEDYQETLDAFLSKAQNDASKTGAKLVVFYQPRTKLDEAGEITNITDQEALSLFKTACEQNDIIFVDLTEPFEELYSEKNIIAHGFNNTAVGAGHLNEAGHRVVAETLARAAKGGR